MNEYMFLIRNNGDGKAGMNAEMHLEFVNKCKSYIEDLKKEGKMISAQPLIREGVVISLSNGTWQEKPVNIHGEIQVGYYHIRANNLDEAIQIAKGNPEFEYTPGATIEVRPLKVKEESNQFDYPSIK